MQIYENSHLRKSINIFLSLMLLLSFIAPSLQAQNRRSRQTQAYGKQIEKKVVAPDSAAIARRDSLRQADSLRRGDSLSMLGKSSLDMPAFSGARDTIYQKKGPDGGMIGYYFGDVKVSYQDMELTADYMEYDMKAGTVYARGTYDSLNGEWIGRPKMTQGQSTYEMEEVRYNFNTGKARITNMVTTEDEGILHGQNIKMFKDHSINITQGKYTVCDAEHPHYYLALSSARTMREPSQKTIFGPAVLVVEDVTLPIGLPFGFIPKRPQRATGLLMPTFGEEQARGFFMRDLGMYFVFGDHFDLSVTGDYYTLGSWAINVDSRYKVNYKFNGGFSLNYSNDQTGEKGTPEFRKQTNFGVKWSHSQDSKAHPGSTFSASVNFSSPSNSRYNSNSLSEALQSQTSSSIAYSRNWNGKINLSLSGQHSQNMRDSSYSFTIPNLNFSVSTFYPFKRKERVGKEKIYEKISFGYRTSLQNRVSFKASELKEVNLLDKFENGMNHDFSIGLPNFQLFKYISVTPGVSYSQKWYFRETNYEYNPETDKVEAHKSSQFSTLGISQNYSANLSMSTRIYGTFNFGQHRKLQAIRHVISPSVGLSYTPDLATRFNGYRTLNYTDASGQEKVFQYNAYTGSTSVSGGPNASMSINIGNNLEAKVKDYADTTGKGTKKVKLIDQFNISTSYNFLSEQFKLSDIAMSMSTQLFNKLPINASASFDPYAIDDKGVKINEFAITRGQGFARLKSFNLSTSYSLSGKGTINGDDGSKQSGGGGGSGSSANYYQRVYYHPITGEFIPDGWLYYTNPNVPWSLNMSASLSYTAGYRYNSAEEKLEKKNTFRATLSLSGNIKLTPRLSMNMSSGYDFIARQMTSTQLSATYDLHCFNISVNCIPIGRYKQYSFTIAANAAQLADLLRFKKSSSYWDN